MLVFVHEKLCGHLNLTSANACPHDDVGELHQVQDVPLLTAQAHCLSQSSILLNSFVLDYLATNKQTRRSRAAGKWQLVVRKCLAAVVALLYSNA